MTDIAAVTYGEAEAVVMLCLRKVNVVFLNFTYSDTACSEMTSSVTNMKRLIILQGSNIMSCMCTHLYTQHPSHTDKHRHSSRKTSCPNFLYFYINLSGSQNATEEVKSDILKASSSTTSQQVPSEQFVPNEIEVSIPA